MKTLQRKEHWEKIYQTKNTDRVGWYQPIPTTSLDLINMIRLSKRAKIVDIGGGTSFLTDNLLKLGYDDVSVLDISNHALKEAKERLGKRSEQVTWINSDVLLFHPKEKFDLWHDRAAFHFQTDKDDIDQYLDIVNHSIKPGGYLIIGTFSDKGPDKCSGIPVKQYTEATMNILFEDNFEKMHCITLDHHTPSGAVQNYIFCCFRKV